MTDRCYGGHAFFAERERKESRPEHKRHRSARRGRQLAIRSSRSYSLVAALCVVALSPALAEEPPASQVDLKKLSVAELVELLVSPFPAPYFSDPRGPKFFLHPHCQEGRFEVIHPQVIAASDELVARGLDTVPHLLKNREDKRYCWTVSGGYNYSVGRRVDQIVETILRPEVVIDRYEIRGYREQPEFHCHLRRVGVERYLEWSKRTTERERELRQRSRVVSRSHGRTSGRRDRSDLRWTTGGCQEQRAQEVVTREAGELTE
jgi:hypothetical protein